MIDQAELERLKAEADLVRLFDQDGAVVERAGAHHRSCCPFHDERTPSCQIYEDHYHCFGCGAHGDAIAYLQAKRGLGFGQAVEVLGGMPPAPPERRPKRKKNERWLPILPVPERVAQMRPSVRHYTHGDPVAIWCYRDQVGQLLFVDARYEYEKDGEQTKAVITACWCRHVDNGEQRWVHRLPPKPCPLYGLDRLKDGMPVLISEGCKAADGAHQLVGDTYACLSWRGGSNATGLRDTDWSLLAGRDVWIWPDADEPGAKAAQAIAYALAKAEARTIRIVDTDGLPKGWDLADACA